MSIKYYVCRSVFIWNLAPVSWNVIVCYGDEKERDNDWICIGVGTNDEYILLDFVCWAAS